MKKYMNSKALFLSIFAFAMLNGCDANNVILDDKCELKEERCLDGVLYQCQKSEKENVLYWKVKAVCDYGCASESENGENTENINIANKCKILCAEGVGYNPDGSCKCNNTCYYGCLEDGSCRHPGYCVQEKYKDTGECACLAACSEDCYPDGRCKSSDDTCYYGRLEDGSCRHPDYCVRENDKYEDNGACKCLDACQDHCYPDGSCKVDDYVILVEPVALRLYSDDEPASFSVQYKKNDSIEDTKEIRAKSLDESCVTVSPNLETSEFIVTVASTTNCNTFIEVNDNFLKATSVNIPVTVVVADANQNHMHDKYEKAPKQGVSCLRHSDCDSEKGAGDGFCDSLIGYQCSTRCTDNAQCVQSDVEYAEGKTFNYACRSDGRCAPDAFVFVLEIKEDNKIFNYVFGGDYLLSVDWGDGKTNDKIEPYDAHTHGYSEPGEYVVTAKGKLNLSMAFPIGGVITPLDSAKKIKKIIAFGPAQLGEYAFAYTEDIEISGIDIPNPVNLKTLAHAFESSNYNGDVLNKWDTSNVTDMSYMFNNAVKFDQPLDNWDTSNVTDMSYMFNNAVKFDQPLDKWDTSKVTTMASMFSQASQFNQSLKSWETSNVTDMSNMFYGAKLFDQSLNDWNVENVTTMNSMFMNAVSFNQALDKWNPKNVKDMQYMFNNAKFFDGKLGNWNTEKLENTYGMFQYTEAFNQPINFNTTNVKDMREMFDNAEAFNSSFGEYWNTQNVTDMSNMFSSTIKFNQDLDDWNTSSVTDMNAMFRYAKAFNGNVGSWNTEKVENMSNMFAEAIQFNRDLNWNTANVTNMNSMFYGATNFNGKFGDNWNTSKVTDMLGMFNGAAAFNQDISNWDTQNVTTMHYMFNDARLFDQDLSGWNYSKVTAFTNMLAHTAMIAGDGSEVTKPASKDDNFCNIYKKIIEDTGKKEGLVKLLTDLDIEDAILTKCEIDADVE